MPFGQIQNRKKRFPASVMNNNQIFENYKQLFHRDFYPSYTQILWTTLWINCSVSRLSTVFITFLLNWLKRKHIHNLFVINNLSNDNESGRLQVRLDKSLIPAVHN